MVCRRQGLLLRAKRHGRRWARATVFAQEVKKEGPCHRSIAILEPNTPQTSSHMVNTWHLSLYFCLRLVEACNELKFRETQKGTAQIR